MAGRTVIIAVVVSSRLRKNGGMVALRYGTTAGTKHRRGSGEGREMLYMGIDADDRFRPPTMKQTLRTPSSVSETDCTVALRVCCSSLRVHLHRPNDYLHNKFRTPI
jgi:hypothetical protein